MIMKEKEIVSFWLFENKFVWVIGYLININEEMRSVRRRYCDDRSKERNLYCVVGVFVVKRKCKERIYCF